MDYFAPDHFYNIVPKFSSQDYFTANFEANFMDYPEDISFDNWRIWADNKIWTRQGIKMGGVICYKISAIE